MIISIVGVVVVFFLSLSVILYVHERGWRAGFAEGKQFKPFEIFTQGWEMTLPGRGTIKMIRTERGDVSGSIKTGGYKPQRVCNFDTCSTVGRLQVKNEDLKAMVEKTNQKIKRCDDYIAQSIGVFRQVEWTAMYHTGKSCFVDICPVCRNEKADGHKPGCQLERILAITPAEAMKRAVDIVDALKGARHLLKVYEEHGYIPIDGNQMFLTEAIQKVDSAIWRYGEAARNE